MISDCDLRSVAGKATESSDAHSHYEAKHAVVRRIPKTPEESPHAGRHRGLQNPRLGSGFCLHIA